MHSRTNKHLLKLTFFALTVLAGEGHAVSGSNTCKTLNINSGTYELSSTINDDIAVSGATFSGTGNINGNLRIENGSTLSAGIASGNRIGNIIVGGDYTQSSDSTFAVDISGSERSDFLLVRNDAHLAGNLEVNVLDAPVIAPSSHIIMHADGDIGGSFASITTNDDSTKARLAFVETNGGTNAVLKVSNYFLDNTRTDNQKQIGQLLANEPNPVSLAAQNLRSSILSMAQASDTTNEALQVFDQMSGYQYGSVLPIAELAVNQFIRRLYNPLRSIVTTYREAPNCWDPAYFDPYSNLPVMLDAPCTLCSPIPPTLDLWFEIGGGRAYFEGNSNAKGFHLNNFEITAGVQTTFLSDWTLGCALSYVRQSFKHKHDGNGGINNCLLGFYGLYRPIGWYALADIVLGANRGSFKRNVDTDEESFSSRGRPRTYEVVFYAEAGFDYNWRAFLIQPFLGFEAGSYSRNGIHEYGGGPVAIDVLSSDKSTASSRLGFHFTTTPKILCRWALSFDLAWQYRFSSAGSSFRAFSPEFGDNFSGKGITTDRNAIDFAGTLSTEIFENCDFYGEFMLLGSSNLFSYDFIAGIKYRW